MRYISGFHNLVVILSLYIPIHIPCVDTHDVIPEILTFRTPPPRAGKRTCQTCQTAHHAIPRSRSDALRPPHVWHTSFYRSVNAQRASAMSSRRATASPSTFSSATTAVTFLSLSHSYYQPGLLERVVTAASAKTNSNNVKNKIITYRSVRVHY